MPSAEVKLLKLAEDSRKSRKKLTGIGQQVEHSTGPAVVVNLEVRDLVAEGRPWKRHRGGNAANAPEDNPDRGFMLLPCFFSLVFWTCFLWECRLKMLV